MSDNQDCDCPPELEDPARDFKGDGWHCENCGGELETSAEWAKRQSAQDAPGSPEQIKTLRTIADVATALRRATRRISAGHTALVQLWDAKELLESAIAMDRQLPQDAPGSPE